MGAPRTQEGTMRLRRRLALVTAMAMLAVAVGAVAASADVERYQVTDYEITVEVNANPNFTHTFLIHYDPDADDQYTGTGSVGAIDEFLSDFEMAGSRLSFTSLYDRADNYTWYPAFILGDEPDLVFDGSGPSVVPGDTTGMYTMTEPSPYKNHGQYVREADDKQAAAHSLIGMPKTSKKNK